jgi:hypothetical protein
MTTREPTLRGKNLITSFVFAANCQHGYSFSGYIPWQHSLFFADDRIGFVQVSDEDLHVSVRLHAVHHR